MLDQDLKDQLAAYLERLQQPIELVASLDDSEAARELDALLDDIAALSPKISRATGDDARKPSFLLAREEDRARLLHGAMLDQFPQRGLGHVFERKQAAKRRIWYAGHFRATGGNVISQRLWSRSD